MREQSAQPINVNIQRLHPNAKLPFYATPGSAGIDLSACMEQPMTIKRGALAVVPTGIAIGLPNASHVAYVYARSGLGIKHGICLSNGVGVIDSDYTGEIRVGLVNLGPADYTIQPGDRIAQLVVAPVERVCWEECETLTETQRGAGGFGSTGQ